MGMGYGAGFDLVISYEDVHKIVQEEFETLEKLLQRHHSSWAELALAIQVDDYVEAQDADDATAIDEAYHALVDSFEDVTGIGLELRHHSSSDEGDRYDEVDGEYWSLDFHKVYQYTPEAESLRSQGVDIDMKFFVSFG